MCPAGHRPIISTINNNKLPSLISLSRDPIFGVQDERKLSTINNKALNYKRSPLRRSGKRGAANCKARIFPYRPKKMPTLTHLSCFRVRLQEQKRRFFLSKTASLAGVSGSTPTIVRNAQVRETGVSFAFKSRR